MKEARADAEWAADKAIESKNDLDSIKTRVARAEGFVKRQTEDIANMTLRQKELAAEMAELRKEEKRLQAHKAEIVEERVAAKKTRRMPESDKWTVCRDRRL